MLLQIDFMLLPNTALEPTPTAPSTFAKATVDR